MSRLEIEGEHTLDENEIVVCKCGAKDKFKIVSHIDMEDRSITNYVCECGNQITVGVKTDRSWW